MLCSKTLLTFSVLVALNSCQKNQPDSTADEDTSSQQSSVGTHTQTPPIRTSAGQNERNHTPINLSLLEILPTGPSDQLNPVIKGNVSESSDVTLYFDAQCSRPRSSAYPSGTFHSDGIQVTGTVTPNDQTNIFAKAVNNSGQTSACTLLGIYTHSSPVAQVTSVSSPAANSSYLAGEQIAISITFSAPVNVSGTPILALKNDSSISTAEYVIGSGSDVLIFSYTIGVSDNVEDLDYISDNALALNGGQIVDSQGNLVSLKLPPPGGYSSIAGQKNLIIDTIPPNINPITIIPGSPGKSTTPTVEFSLSEDASVGLFSDSNCFVSANNITNVEKGASRSLKTSHLISNSTSSIYAKATDPAGNASGCTFMATYLHDDIPPEVISFTRDPGQAASTNNLPMHFVVTFSEPILTDSFTESDLINAGTAIGVVWQINAVTSSTFNIIVTDAGNGTIKPRIPANSLHDTALNSNTVNLDASQSINSLDSGLSVDINQLSSQADPVNQLPINFKIVFSSPIQPNSFNITDIIQNGTASGITWTLSTSDNITWNLQATSVQQAGTIVPSIAANSAIDAFGNKNSESTNDDNSVHYDLVTPTITFNTISPSILGTTLRPTVYGSVSEASSVTLFFDSACSTPRSSTIDNQTFASLGLIVHSNTLINGSTSIYARAVDLAGNTSSCMHLTTYHNDSIVPTVSYVTSSSYNGIYTAQSIIPIHISFSENIFVSGNPKLILATGASSATATYSSGSGTSTLIFNYLVWYGDNATKLDYQTTSSLILNGGTIKDEAGNNATLTLPVIGSYNSLGGSKNISIDTTPPTLIFISSSPTSPGNTRTPQLTLALSESFVNLRLYSDPSCSTNLSGSLSGAQGLQTLSTWTLPANFTTQIFGKATDLIGNNSSCTLLTSYTHDNTAPIIESISSPSYDSTYGVGAVISVVLTISEPVHVTGIPVLTLATGGGTNNADIRYLSGSGSRYLTFEYTVAPGQTSADLDVNSTTALSLNGGTIKDQALNNALLTLPNPGSSASLSAANNIVIDTTQFGMGCSARGLKTADTFRSLVEFDSSSFIISVASDYNTCTRLALDANCTYQCFARIHQDGTTTELALREGLNRTAVAYENEVEVDFEIGLKQKTAEALSPIETRMSYVYAGYEKIYGYLYPSVIAGFHKRAIATIDGENYRPEITSPLILSSNGSTLRPTVAMDVSMSAAYAYAAITLFTDPYCSQAISDSYYFSSGPAQQLQANTLEGSKTIEIYGQAYDYYSDLMTTCVYFGQYTTP
jgi:hypothetical protein